MKQRITPEQLQELTDEQKQHLRNCWEPRTVDVTYIENMNFEDRTLTGYDTVFVSAKKLHSINYRPLEYTKEDCLPLLNTGQMIEVLQNKIVYFNMTNMFAGTGDKICWGIFKPKTFDMRADELCDALWHTVKRVLYNV